VLNFLILIVFVLLLPLLVVAALIWGQGVTGAAGDSIWLVKVSFTVLGPFSVALWTLIICHILNRRSHHWLVFLLTAAAIVLLLRLGVYTL
jgi:hypothetical protein